MPIQYNVNQLKLAVAGYTKLAPENFVRKCGADTIDLLLQSCNNARLYAERMIDFEYSRAQAYLVIASLVDGADLDDAITWETRSEDEDDQVSIKIKKITTPWISNNTSDLTPVKLSSKRAWNKRITRRSSYIADNRAVELTEQSVTDVYLVQNGRTVFVSPASTNVFTSGSVTMALDVIKWLDSYVDGNETDFLLEFCFDWMIWRAIYELNQYLKEDERVPVNEKLMLEAWDSVVKWNNELVESISDDNTLD